MTPQTFEAARSARTADEPDARPPVSRSRLLTIVMMIGSLLVTGTLQNVVSRRQHELIRNTASAATLSNLNSFSLALLLGGLRGPLVMLLWTSSENQKHDKDLEDFNTKIDLIRLLQPEFDSVHIFQIWNLAYNISVQMVNNANKYAAILEAVDYCHKIDEQHPNDINTMASYGQLFFDKLGNSAEKYYYRARVRSETQWREPDTIRPGDPGWRRTKLDPMLDKNGDLLPNQLVETSPRPASLPADAGWNTGAELQYLKKFEPWPYGLPPMGIGYNYYKRAQVLQEVSHQRHLQLGDVVMDNRPAISLKLWGEAEAADAVWVELKAFNRTPKDRPAERTELEMATSNVPLTATTADPAALAEAIYHYDVTARICDEAEIEYHRHLSKYVANFNNFLSHINSIVALKFQSRGDRDYLRAMTAAPGERPHLREQATAAYQAAITQYQLLILRYYLPEIVEQRLLPPGLDRSRLGTLTPEQINSIVSRAQQLLAANPQIDSKASERREYEIYMARCIARLDQLKP